MHQNSMSFFFTVFCSDFYVSYLLCSYLFPLNHFLSFYPALKGKDTTLCDMKCPYHMIFFPNMVINKFEEGCVLSQAFITKH